MQCDTLAPQEGQTTTKQDIVHAASVLHASPPSEGHHLHYSGPHTGFAAESGKGHASALTYVMNLIHAPSLTAQQVTEVTLDVKEAWSKHINPGFLKYRKSVADDYASIEWRDGAPGGATMIDATGREYIDCLGGFGIYNVGHSHPTVVQAVQAQLLKQPLNSQELLDPLRAYCAALLVQTLPGDLQYAFFTNSGTESVECALKMAMLSTGRTHFIGLIGAFHGKSLGSLSGTSKAVFRKPFSGVLLPFTHIPVNDCAALRRAFESAAFTGDEIAGLLLEPILGEGGIHECSPEFLRLGRQLCDEAGACLIFDEVQSGMGRTGRMWACEESGVAPDIIAIAKAFGGGVMAAGATVGTERVWNKLFDTPFLHTTTFGGNPCAMAAAIATLSVIHDEGLCEAAARSGAYFKSGLQRLAAAHPHVIVDVRGRGLMLGLQFPTDLVGFAFSKGCFARGVILSGTLSNARVVRVEPPLTITTQQIDAVLGVMTSVLADVDSTLRIERAGSDDSTCHVPMPSVRSSTCSPSGSLSSRDPAAASGSDSDAGGVGSPASHGSHESSEGFQCSEEAPFVPLALLTSASGFSSRY